MYAGYNYYREAKGRPASRASAVMNLLLGLWLIAAPFAFGANGVLLWNDVVVGSIVTLLAAYNWSVAEFEVGGAPSAAKVPHAPGSAHRPIWSVQMNRTVLSKRAAVGY